MLKQPHGPEPKREDYQEVQEWYDTYFQWAKRRIDDLDGERRVIDADLRWSRKETEKEKEKAVAYEQVIASYQKVIETREAQTFFKPGTDVFVGPEGFQAKVISVMVKHGGVSYQVQYWDFKLLRTQWLPADEVTDELPLLPPGP